MNSEKTYHIGYAAVDGGWRVCWRVKSARSMLNYVDGPPLTSEYAAEQAAGYFKRGLEFANFRTTPGLEFYP